MTIDGKSFILGAIVGGCIVVFRASVSVAKNQIKTKRIEEEIEKKSVQVKNEKMKDFGKAEA